MPRSTLLRSLALVGLAALAALLSNALAPAPRRLAWGPSQAASTPAGPRAEKPLALRPPEPGPTIPPEPRKTGSASPKAIPPPRPFPRKDAAGVQEPPPFSPIRDISDAEAWAAFQAGAPFLDARRSSEYGEGHIAGAWCIPVWEADLDERLITFKARRRPGAEDPIVLYCSGGACRDSHLLAEKLLKDGYFNLQIYREGYPAWVAQGHPVEKGQP